MTPPALTVTGDGDPMSATPPKPEADQPAADQPPEDELPPAATRPDSTRRRRTRRPRRAVDPGRGPEPVWHGSAWEDDPRAWGDRGEDQEQDSDERILRERPPHW